jgi:hypothetical protein
VVVSSRESLLARAALLSAQAAPMAIRAAPAPAATAVAVPAAPAVPAPPAAVAQPSGVAAVTQALEAWRLAWSRLDVPGYLEAYAPGFVPARAASRAAWEANRRSVLGRAKNVSVAFEGVTVQLQDEDHATTTFRQVYRSASYRDQVTKTVRWQRMGTRWVIVGETASDSR